MFLDEAASEKSGAGKPPALGGWVLCPASVNPNEQIRIVDVMQEVAQSALPLDHATIMLDVHLHHLNLCTIVQHS